MGKKNRKPTNIFLQVIYIKYYLGNMMKENIKTIVQKKKIKNNPQIGTS